VSAPYLYPRHLAGGHASPQQRWQEGALGRCSTFRSVWETSAPIGSLTEQQLFTKNREVLQDWEERQPRDGNPVAAKKRRTDLESDIIIEKNALQRLVETAAANACRGFIGPAATGSSVDDIRSLRDEVMENIARVQT
jgi:hypothetical protein